MSFVSGGARAAFSREMLCGYVICDEAVDGAVAHTGMHGECPHRIKVCIVKKGSSAGPYRRLREQAERRGRNR